MFLDGVTVEFAFFTGSRRSPEVEVEFATEREDVGLTLVSVGESVDSTEPSVDLLGRLSGVDSDVGAAVDDEVVPEDLNVL